MELITIFFIAVSLAMDAFAVSVSNGICVKGFRKVDSIRQGIYFGLFQFLMPLIGWFLGNSVREYIETVDHWIAFVLLAAIGGNMIRESRQKENDDCTNQKKLTAKELIPQAIATSIDALAVGISLAILNVNILTASVIIGLVAFFFSYVGGIFGRGLGMILQKKAELAGGAVLILIGLRILAEHLFFQ